MNPMHAVRCTQCFPALVQYHQYWGSGDGLKRKQGPLIMNRNHTSGFHATPILAQTRSGLYMYGVHVTYVQYYSRVGS